MRGSQDPKTTTTKIKWGADGRFNVHSYPCFLRHIATSRVRHSEDTATQSHVFGSDYSWLTNNHNHTAPESSLGLPTDYGQGRTPAATAVAKGRLRTSKTRTEEVEAAIGNEAGLVLVLVTGFENVRATTRYLTCSVDSQPPSTHPSHCQCQNAVLGL